jgi:hypothetical protein
MIPTIRLGELSIARLMPKMGINLEPAQQPDVLLNNLLYAIPFMILHCGYGTTTLIVYAPAPEKPLVHR